MAAGVHHAGHAAHPRRLDLGRERQVDLLLDRQRIHVGAERHHAARLSSLEDADHAGVADAGLHLVAQRRQMLGDQRRGAGLVIGELGVLMDVAPPGDDLVLEAQRRRRHPLGNFTTRLRHQRVHRALPRDQILITHHATTFRMLRRNHSAIFDFSTHGLARHQHVDRLFHCGKRGHSLNP
jgi:hypothetical protein